MVGRPPAVTSRRIAAVAVTVLWFAAAPAAADATGPELEEAREVLEAALACSAEVDDATTTPVLLVHGTAATHENTFGWNLVPALAAEGRPTCTVTIPDRALGDLQHNVEFVVHAVRRVAERSGRPIAVVGHSQGGFLPLFALRYWPDLVPLVDDWIGIATGSTMGTTQADSICALPCTPAFHQFRPSSEFMAAVSRTPLPDGPSYTSILSLFDEVVTPQPAASTIDHPGAANVVIQDHCPVDPHDHVTIPGWAGNRQLVLDAIDHGGPADPDRAGPLACGFMDEAVGAAPALAAVDFLAGIPTRYPGLHARAAAGPRPPTLRSADR